MYTAINGNIMTPKQLRAIVRETINEVLNEDSNVLVGTKGGTKSVSYKTAAELADLKSDPNVTSMETTAGQKIKEMARKAKGYELINPEIDETPYGVKTISGTSLANIITFFRENPGAEKTDVQRHFGFVRPQIANAIVNGLVDAGILAKAGSVTVDDETGETTVAAEEEPTSTRLDAEDFFVGSRAGSFFAAHEPKTSDDEDEEEMEIPEEPEIPELPSERSTTALSGLSDGDYNAWMEYSKYKERAARIKSALIQLKKQKRGGDDLSYESNEAERLAVKKAEYEARLKSIIDSNKYVKNKVEQEKNKTSEEDELNETVLRRFKKLANILHD